MTQQSELNLQGIDFEEGYIAVIDKPLEWTSSDVVRKSSSPAQGRLPENQGRPCRNTRSARNGHPAGLHRQGDQNGGRPASRGERVRRRPDAGRYDPQLRPRTPHRQDYPFEHITREAVEEVLRSLTGERLQTPPLYSAKKVEGVRAYELARAGEEVELRKALINIYEMELMEYDLPRIRIRVRCSKGTYIRSLAGEIGQALGSGAHLTSLCRTRSGGFRLDAAHELNFFLEKLQKAETK